jgi:hypothetical protein
MQAEKTDFLKQNLDFERVLMHPIANHCSIKSTSGTSERAHNDFSYHAVYKHGLQFQHHIAYTFVQ